MTIDVVKSETLAIISHIRFLMFFLIGSLETIALIWKYA